MQIEHCELSLVGDRDDNQDRAGISSNDHAAFVAVVDGMGGHSDGSRAAETALKSLLESFNASTHPTLDPMGFMHMSLSKAHDEVVRAGAALSVDSRPRATCAVCLVQEGMAYWAHVGDSRIYHIRNGNLLYRSRDHSHIELLLRDGKITEDEMQNHPMRNFVECCLGGDPAIPEMTLSLRQSLQQGDMILLCTDGIWANMPDKTIASFYTDFAASQDSNAARPELKDALVQLAHRAVKASAPYSDNSTVAVLRYLGP